MFRGAARLVEPILPTVRHVDNVDDRCLQPVVRRVATGHKQVRERPFCWGRQNIFHHETVQQRRAACDRSAAAGAAVCSAVRAFGRTGQTGSAQS